MSAQPDWEPRVEALEADLGALGDKVDLFSGQWRAVGEIAVEGRRLAKATTPALQLVHKDVKAHWEEFKTARENTERFQAETGDRLDRIEGLLARIAERLDVATDDQE